MTTLNAKYFLKAVTGILCGVSILLGGCESMSEREKGGIVGAGMGAVGGAAISSATGGDANTGAVVGGIMGAVAGNLWSKRQEERRRAMEQASQGTGVQVSRTPDNQLKLNVPSDISFDTNSAAIKPELQGILETFANSLRGDAKVRVRVIGHTDSRGSDGLNNPLSVHRAQSVRNFLQDRGIDGSRIETAGRGKHEPIASNATDSGRAKNRRVEIFLREPA
jgi:outer membrane protein OmpA-like peptidoglycan-associated protein